MTDQELEDVRRLLEDQRDALYSENRQHIATIGGSEGQPLADLADQASGVNELDIAVATAFQGGEELTAVVAALDRLDAGTYGQCETCDQAIATPRMKALPTAALCIDCQRELEASGASRTAFDDADHGFGR